MTRHEVSPWLIAGVGIAALVVAVLLAVLRLDLETASAEQRGRTVAPYQVGATPTTYGPPPA